MEDIIQHHAEAPVAAAPHTITKMEKQVCHFASLPSSSLRHFTILRCLVPSRRVSVPRNNKGNDLCVSEHG